MLFKRREKLSLTKQILGWLWPRSGVKRAWTYLFHRIGRLPGTTHSIAAGIASGAAVSFTPFIGLHFLLGFAVAWATRGNLLASAIGTAIGNPWTFPFIFALTGQVGTVLLGYDVSTDVPPLSMDALWADPITYMAGFLPVIFPLLVGGVPVAIIIWLLFYVAFRGLISGYRESRSRRKKARLDNEG